MTNRRNSHSNPEQRNRAIFTPATSADVISITNGASRRIRRWDEPQPSNPNSEHPVSTNGVCQGDHQDEPHDWEFTDRIPTAGAVVGSATAAQGQVITLRPDTSHHRRPVSDINPIAVQPRPLRLSWWAVGLSIVAQMTVTAAIEWGDADPVIAAAVSIGILICSILLIAAEQITGRSNQ